MDDENTLSRTEALSLYTQGSAWFSQEENSKGTLEPGKFADIAVLSGDYFTVPEETINTLQSVLTIVDGKVVYAAEEFAAMDPGIEDVIPGWSPVKYYGGYQHQ